MEKEFDDSVYEDEYYEEHYDEEELDEEESSDDEEEESSSPAGELAASSNESSEEEESDEDSWEDEKKIQLSFACEDCDYRWDDVIYKKRGNLEDEEEEFDPVCPMCGSMSVTQI